MTPLRILITGINGKIARLLRTAFRDVHELYGLDRVGPLSDRVSSANVAEYKQVAQVVQQFSPLDCIIHLAGDPNVQASWESVLIANIIGTRNVFEAAREFHVRRVIFASSNHVTGAYEGFEPNLILHTARATENLDTGPHSARQRLWCEQSLWRSRGALLLCTLGDRGNLPEDWRGVIE